jgi:predicted amidophosphoribosyltransferase
MNLKAARSRARLFRQVAVPKSATAAAGQRPGPDKHYNSLAVAPNVNLLVASITIVDDVITRGATLIACYARLREIYPQTPIQCFSLIRTMSNVEVDSVLDPVAGIVTYHGGSLHRHP